MKRPRVPPISAGGRGGLFPRFLHFFLTYQREKIIIPLLLHGCIPQIVEIYIQREEILLINRFHLRFLDPICEPGI